MYSGRKGCIRSKVVVFGIKWFYSGNKVVLVQKWLYSGKMVVFGQKGKDGSIREKVALFG